MARGRKVSKTPIPTVSKRALQPTLHLLERFSASDLETWRRRSAELDRLHQLLFYGLEPERNERRDEILKALNSRQADPITFEQWTRVVEYRFSDQPLSSIGSVLGPGGRFNIGNGCDAYIKGRGFPALYVGDSQETAYREFYQCAAKDLIGSGLTRQELALRRSDASVQLNGHIERVFDASKSDALIPVAKVLAKFKVPAELEDIAKSLRLGPASAMLIRTPAALREHIQDVNWRAWPIQFGLPSPSQRFGEFLFMAGFEAVKYASAKNPGQTCLAIFSGNFANSRSYLELADPSPSSVKHRRLDIDSAKDLAGHEYLDLGPGPSSIN